MTAETLIDLIPGEASAERLRQVPRTSVMVADGQVETRHILVKADPAFVIFAPVPQNVGLSGATLSEAE